MATSRKWTRALARARRLLVVFWASDWIYADEDLAAFWAWCTFDASCPTAPEARMVAASLTLDGMPARMPSRRNSRRLQPRKRR